MTSFRFTIILLILFLSCALSGQYIIPDEKIVDLSVENMSFREVLITLAEENDVTIAFQDEIIPGDSIVSLSVRSQRLGRLLDYLIEDHGLRYRIVGQQIVIQKDQFSKSKENLTISGYITDLYSGEALISAYVYLYDESAGTTSNEYGFYSITLPKGMQRLKFSYLGYNTAIHEVTLKSDTTINITLDPFNRLNEITITAEKIIEEQKSPDITTIDILPVEKISATLPLGGEPDVMRMALIQPGITSGADGFGGMSVRGGSVNQNLILLDGIPVYNANHAFGLFSLFNSNVIKSAKIYKGAFPSHYSGRLSSVMDIRTREGNNQKFSGDVSVGLLTMKASFEGPIVKDKASFLFSARRTFVDPWIEMLTESLKSDGESGSTSLYFYDINSKLNFQLGSRSKLFLSYYRGKDNFRNTHIEVNDTQTEERLDELQWESGNELATLRWNLQLSRKAFLQMSGYYSDYLFESFDHNRFSVFESGNLNDATYDAGVYNSQITDKGGRMVLDWYPSTKHKFKIGAGYIDHRFKPGLRIVDHVDNIVPIEQPITKDQVKQTINLETIKGTETEIFIEDNIALGEHTSLNIGYNHLIVHTGKTYHIHQPRILFNTGSDQYSFDVSWGMMGQYLHSLTNSGLGVPVDLWLPSTDKIEPEKSWIASMGQKVDFQKAGIFSTSIYYKRLFNLAKYGQNGLLTISDNSNWEDLLPAGTGESYGLELSYANKTSKTDIQVSYTLSWANRQFDHINNGQKFRFRYDRRHVISLGVLHKLNESVEFSSNWEFGSGNPTTIDNGQSYFYRDEDGNETLVLIFDEIHNDVLPTYHRLDLGVNFYNKYKWGRTKLTLGLYNVYNRQNPFYRDVIVEKQNNVSNIKYQELTILPILPTFSYNVSF